MTKAIWTGLAATESSGDLRILSSPSVTVTDKSDGSTPQLYSDRAGNTAIGNPFTANADGSIEFYVESGRYRIEASKDGNTATWEDSLIGTSQGYSVDQLQVMANAGVEASTADGISATSDGDYFWVPDSDVIKLYKNNSGSALYVDDFPNLQKVNNLLNAAVADAEQARDDSRQARDESEQARDQAIQAVDTYSSTANGLAATSDGDYFTVPESGRLVLYLNNAGTAVEQLKYAGPIGGGDNEIPTNAYIDGYGVDSVSALQSGSYPASLDRIWLSGYYGVGTAGGGPLYRDSADTTTADNGGTVFVDADGVRWKRSVHDGKLRPEMFGGRLNQDSGPEIQATFDAVNNGEGDCIAFNAGTWIVSQDISASLRDGVWVEAWGAKFITNNTGASVLFLLEGPGEVLTTTLTSDAAEGSTSVTLNDVTGIQEGDLIQITSDEPFADDNGPASATNNLIEVQVVTRVDGSTVYLDAPMIANITSAGSTNAGGDGVLHAEVWRPSFNNRWHGGDFVFNNDVDNCLRIKYTSGMAFEGIRFVDTKRNSLEIQFSAYDLTNGCRFERSGTFDRVTETTDFGYGVIHARSCYSIVSDCTGLRGWHTFESAYGTRDVRYIACQGHTERASFNCHSGCGRISYIGIVADGNRCIQHAAKYEHVIGGTLRSTDGYVATCRGNAMLGIRRIFYDGVELEQADSASTRIFQLAGNAAGAQKFGDTEVHFNGCVHRGSGSTDIISNLGATDVSQLFVSDSRFLWGAYPFFSAIDEITLSGITKEDNFGSATLSVIKGNGKSVTTVYADDIVFRGTAGSNAGANRVFDIDGFTGYFTGVKQTMEDYGYLFRDVVGQTADVYIQDSVITDQQALDYIRFARDTNLPAVRNMTCLTGTYFVLGGSAVIGHKDSIWWEKDSERENYSNASVSPDGTGEATIAHGLSSTPNYVNANIRGDNVNGVDVVSVSGTNITVRIKDASGADVTSGTFTVDWFARV